MKKTKTAVIVLPTYNEKENISILIPEIFSLAKKIKNRWKLLVLVVDDNSPDKTGEKVKELQKKYKELFLITGKKEGLGKAYQRGFAYAIKHLNPDVLFEMDSDLQHPPNLIPKFLSHIENGAEFVIGSRYIKGGSIPANWEFHRKFLSYVGNLIFKIGFMNFSISDWTSGYRALKADFVKKTLHKYTGYNGYTFQISILNQAIENNLIISEIPLNFLDRTKGGSKINTLEFSINNILFILKNSSFIKFSIVGLVGTIIDFSFSYIFISIFKLYVWLSTSLSGELAIISNFLLNNFWSFSNKKIYGGAKKYIKAFFNFNIISLGNIVLQSILMEISTRILPLKYWPLYKAVIIGTVIIPYSYYMYTHFVWKKNKD